MKVALCFFGQPRLLDNPYTWLSHKNLIIDRYNTDVFIHTWISGNEIQFELATHIQEKHKPFLIEDKNSEEKILKKYKPKKYIFEKPKYFSLDEETKNLLKEKKQEYENRINGSFLWTPNNENNTLSQIYSITKVINLLKDEKYDWVILSRYDNYMKDFPNLYQLDSNNLYIAEDLPYNFNDVLIFGGQSQMDSLACYDKIPELCYKISYFASEEFKRVAFLDKYEKEKRFSFDVGVVRTNTLEDIQY
jgi:hypothetical protein